MFGGGEEVFLSLLTLILCACTRCQGWNIHHVCVPQPGLHPIDSLPGAGGSPHTHRKSWIVSRVRGDITARACKLCAWMNMYHHLHSLVGLDSYHQWDM
jgi:hypothetical protein